MKQLFIYPSESIHKSLDLMAKNGEKSLIVVNKNKFFLGVLSDGDIRKSILKGIDLNSNISKIYNKKSFYLIQNMFNKEEVKEIFLRERYNLIPVISKKKKVVDILFWEIEFKKDKIEIKNDINVVIMAGGEGKRLEPFSKILPKPLIPINEKSIINHIIDSFLKYSFTNYTITLNYKKNIIKSFLKDSYKKKISIKYTNENVPTGTAGSLRYLNKLSIKKPFFITNCDIIVKSNYSDIYNWHIKNKNDFTIVVSLVNHQIPYGICDLNKKGNLKKIIEKPSSNYLINTGFYIMSPILLKLIPKDGIYHMTDLIHDCLIKKYKVSIYPIAENDWLDVGQWAEYKKSLQKFEF